MVSAHLFQKTTRRISSRFGQFHRATTRKRISLLADAFD
jgi:hypothetical protein